MKTEKYKLIARQLIDDFNEKVNAMLADGWYLYGPPFNSNGFLCQAMMKDEFTDSYEKKW